MRYALTPVAQETEIFFGRPTCSGTWIVEECVTRAHSLCADLIFPGGEREKTPTAKARIDEALLQQRVDRVIAVGGGAFLDTVGFAAATHRRGVEWIAVPTTPLAMADAAIGGKTAVNVGGIKNSVGVLHHPSQAWIDTAFLTSCNEAHFRDGLAEIMKHALLHDRSLFGFLEDRGEDLLRGIGWDECLRRNAPIKVYFLTADDARGKQKRRLLHLGHGVAHALEETQTLSHGQAVGVGLRVDLWLSDLQERVRALALCDRLLHPVPHFIPEEVIARITKPGTRLTAIGTPHPDAPNIPYDRVALLKACKKLLPS